MAEKHREAFFQEFQVHTLLKHGILSRYVVAWVNILQLKHPRIWLIDGFAGRGRDDAGNDGSPILIARLAAAFQGQGKDVRMVAVEPKEAWFRDLRERLAPFDAENDGLQPIAYLRNANLDDVRDEIFGMIGDDPTFTFLDPFGADGLNREFIRHILSIPKGEVLMLFSAQAVARHLAVAGTSNQQRIMDRAPDIQGGLFPELEEQWLAEELARAQRADGLLLPTKEAALRILCQLFGSQEAVDDLLTRSARGMSIDVVDRFVAELIQLGASHVTPIAIHDARGHCVYYLLHAAKNGLASSKLKEAFESALKHSELPAEVKEEVHAIHAASIPDIARLVGERFAGRAATWTGKVPHSVKEFALRETAMLPSQAKQLRDELQPFEVARSPVRYKFPPV